MSPHAVNTQVIEVIIVGAGIAGLAAALAIHDAGHHVTIVEGASVLREIGAGVLISSNATRELIRWGLEDDLRDVIVQSRVSRVLRWDDGKVLSEVHMDPSFALKKYDAPVWMIHRADLHTAMLKKVKSLGIEIKLASRVVEADVDKASVTLASGEVLDCDFIVGADGVRSKMRDIISLKPVPALPTGDYAFQFALEIEKYKNDPVIAPLVEGHAATAWWGPGRHVIGTLLRGEKLFNCVAVFPDDGSLGDEHKQLGADVDELRRNFSDWCPAVRTILFHADPSSIVKWKLQDLDPLESWHRGHAVLIGDACHPMLPYLAQGASQAIEDGAVLAQCLAHLPLDRVGRAFQDLRFSRATQIQQLARKQKTENHYPDGPEQQARDERLKDPTQVRAWQWEPVAGKPTKSWSDGLFGYDSKIECEEYFREHDAGRLLVKQAV
ncbi:uncharacterized protein Z520_09088 [Fonsecaea multimorphosa CBS 102226]|uniref:FAD-binding domain-containing protein n=1 Tax=Fonsecaea multimorphosa CBS 102226 TaxID=1442371 RepID=A0A0D2JP88_9EURO|nr:uncharacterized protein Z520_09088 [Fonsecaea multimorphosa CBS 102226]KIX95172.1 hypothetical protein Z520_09088 [Fonsecaea multimorphosa CBS 102226]OAL20890.1 hypothetical protein AYO22_08518 [Fonsecaea multimorphosa]